MLKSKLLTFCALGMLLFSGGCDAQNPLPPEERAFNRSQLYVSAGNSTPTAQSGEPKTYSEPTLTGKIIDAETRQPIAGAFVYGHYATSTGTLAGGRKFGEAVKSFMVQTDANGEFRLEGWNSGERQIGGLAGDRFPYIGLYKPGYDMRFERLNSITQWRPKTDDPNAHVTVSNGVHDWRAYPYLLKPAKSESARYFALEISSAPMLMIGECGWEVYAPLLLAQHNELKEWYRRNLPPDALEKTGYVKDYGPLPGEMRQLSLVFKSAVDRLVENAPSGNRCQNPSVIFRDKK